MLDINRDIPLFKSLLSCLCQHKMSMAAKCINIHTSTSTTWFMSKSFPVHITTTTWTYLLIRIQSIFYILQGNINTPGFDTYLTTDCQMQTNSVAKTLSSWEFLTGAVFQLTLSLLNFSNGHVNHSTWIVPFIMI